MENFLYKILISLIFPIIYKGILKKIRETYERNIGIRCRPGI